MKIRIATLDDAGEVEQLLRRAYPESMAAFYQAEILALALPIMTKANPELLVSGTYYVAEDGTRIVGCGGWTVEQPGSRAVRAGLSHLRHFATDPYMTRRGIGRAIFRRCASMAAQRGAVRFQAFAGFNAEPFYESLGLSRLEVIDIQMGLDTMLPTVVMEGPIPSEEHVRARSE